jgi:hypothetical protein
MRKLLGFLPLILSVFAAIYGLFDSSVFTYLNSHATLLDYLAAGFVASEALASTDLVKSNSVAQAIFDFVVTILKRVLHK